MKNLAFYSMLETPDYPALSRVMRVQPRPDEKPASGFSWADYEDVHVESGAGSGSGSTEAATGGTGNDADEDGDGDGDDNDGWGVVKSRGRPSTSSPHSRHQGLFELIFTSFRRTDPNGIFPVPIRLPTKTIIIHRTDEAPTPKCRQTRGSKGCEGICRSGSFGDVGKA